MPPLAHAMAQYHHQNRALNLHGTRLNNLNPAPTTPFQKAFIGLPLSYRIVHGRKGVARVKWPRIMNADLLTGQKWGVQHDSLPQAFANKPATISTTTSTKLQRHKGPLYSYRLSASFSKSSASMNRGTALHSKGMGQLC